MNSTGWGRSTAALISPTADGLLELVGGDLAVPLVNGEWVRYANLDNAASAPALRPAAEAVR